MFKGKVIFKKKDKNSFLSSNLKPSSSKNISESPEKPQLYLVKLEE